MVLKEILSNGSVKANSLFKTMKGAIVEEGLLANSMKKSVDTAHRESKKTYDGIVKLVDEVNSEIGVDVGNPRETLKGIVDHSKDKSGGIFGFTKSMSNETQDKVKETAAMNTIRKGSGLHMDDPNGDYDSIIKSTKGAIAGKAGLNMVDNYYVNPIREAMSANAAGDKGAMGGALSKAGIRYGATAGILSGTVLAGKANKDREIQRF